MARKHYIKGTVLNRTTLALKKAVITALVNNYNLQLDYFKFNDETNEVQFNLEFDNAGLTNTALDQAVALWGIDLKYEVNAQDYGG